ncbi:MAG: SpoIIE family protein phosphatase, partial [Alphaproteobacteria bacterium]|nr:SpoIIE family protein phosphatase [Alphaproteobacteria bacterium]
MGNLDIISNGVDHLALIAEMNYKFTKTRDIKKVLQKGLELVAAHLDAEAASVFLQNDDKSELICRACAGPIDIEGLSIPANEKSIIGETVSKRVSKLVRDVTKDPDFDVNVDKKTGFVTRSILCAPLQFENDCIGAIEVINKRAGNGLFNEQDKKLLEALGSSAALAIINARMAKELIGKEVMRKELELAAEIQRGLLPENLPDDFPVHGINVPAKTVSGDFFDTGKLEDGRVWFNLGDVSGKGMNAALLMAKTSSLFRCLAKTIHSPSKLLAVINNELCETNSKGMFVTMVGGFFDPATGNVCFANAGHEPPLYFDSETKTFIDFPAEAPPLGIARDIAGSDGYPEEEINLNDGSFYIFTDGLTEARTNNKELEEKGVRKLISNI